jgi:DNA polymerase-3 subunit epsilon
VQSAVVLDLETTGLTAGEDQIIEIGLRQFRYNSQTGEILSRDMAYSCFQDPGKPLSPETTQLTGITDQMVAGQKIDWVQVDKILASAELIIAHNAKFDRPFTEIKSKVSQEKIWGCSLKQIDWASKGFPTSKLEFLSIFHGFFCDAHRALNDADALLYLLSLPDEKTGRPYLAELSANARRPMTQVIASSSPFSSKDHLKKRGYSWDVTNRVWKKLIFKDELPAEISWLEATVYTGTFGGICRDISLIEGFKND